MMPLLLRIPIFSNHCKKPLQRASHGNMSVSCRGKQRIHVINKGNLKERVQQQGNENAPPQHAECGSGFSEKFDAFNEHQHIADNFFQGKTRVSPHLALAVRGCDAG